MRLHPQLDLDEGAEPQSTFKRLMDTKLFTFWIGGMPEYIKMCIDTWKVHFVIMNRENIGQYTDMPLC